MIEIGYEISFSITVKKLLAKVRNIFWLELLILFTRNLLIFFASSEY